ncbi:MAG: thiamine-phosphate kinase [Acidobacteria bacterium]|nr:thiamine-phosphate kinase [Acidobacteriota bacterium]
MTTGDLGERALITRVRARLPRPSSSLVVGPGDDAAIVRPGRAALQVLTTDALVEGVHFSRAWCPAASIGHKALAVNLSDIAAMGALPRWALLSLALPADTAVDVVDGLVDGLSALATRHGVTVAGGNITRSPGPIVVDVTVGGEVAQRKFITRAGAFPGDELWLSGTIGGAHAALAILESGGAPPKALASRLHRPTPQVRLGAAVAAHRAARGLIDLSDGLGAAITQLAEASGCGARIDAAAVPVEPEARAWWTRQGLDPIRQSLSGGEDYELLLAVPPRWGGRLRHLRRQVTDPPLTRIGTLTRARTLLLSEAGTDAPLPSGFEHFHP